MLDIISARARRPFCPWRRRGRNRRGWAARSPRVEGAWHLRKSLDSGPLWRLIVLRETGV